MKRYGRHIFTIPMILKFSEMDFMGKRESLRVTEEGIIHESIQ